MTTGLHRLIAFYIGSAAIVGSAAVSISVPASAVPLDPATCEKVSAEQTELYGDVPRLMERGASWAKSNANPQQLKRIARWIELEEQLQFRCGQVRLSPGGTAAAAAAQALEAPPPAAAATGAPNAKAAPNATAAPASSRSDAADAPTAKLGAVAPAKTTPKPKPVPDAAQPVVNPAASPAASKPPKPIAAPAAQAPSAPPHRAD